MLVDSEKLKALRTSRNWTQQYLAEACDLSMRTIQRVEKDGVASNETVAAYAAVFELDAAELILSVEQYEQRYQNITMPLPMLGVVVLASIALGVGVTFWWL